MHWNNYSYNIAEGEAEILTYTGNESCVTIPKMIEGYPVTCIGEEAFLEYGAEIETVYVPKTVKRIKDHAFRMCMSLTEVVLSEGLKELGANAFFAAPLAKLKLPASLEFISGASELGGIPWEVDPKNPWFFTDGFALYRKEREEQVLLAVQQETVCISYQVLDGTSRIGEHAFGGHSYLKEVTLPDSVRVIEAEAFDSCQQLKSIQLSKRLEKIGARAFGHCMELSSLHLPASLRVLETGAVTDTFSWNEELPGLSKITVEEENPVFWVDESALYERIRQDNTQVKLVKYFGSKIEYEIPDFVTCLGEHAFRRAVFCRVSIPESVEYVERDVFRECKQLKFLEIKGDHSVLYIPGTPRYRKEEVAGLLLQCRQNTLYEYPKYDALFDTYFYLEDKAAMAACRLHAPIELGEQQKEIYETYVSEHFTEILTDISKRDDMWLLQELANIGFFTKDTIDAGIDVINQCQNGKLLGYLMDYKQKHFQTEAFDFSF